MRKYILFSLAFVLLGSQIGCNVFDKEEPIPAYLRITLIDFATEKGKSQGTSSSNITDAWLYVNDQTQGVYPLPTRLPLLVSGKTKIKISPGIIQNGIDATRISYPFYNDWDTIVELTQKQIVSLKPRITGYKDATVFHLIEDFEGLGLALAKTVSSPNEIYKTSIPSAVFEGVNCGKFEIINNSTDVTIASSDFYNLPKQGNKVFLEMNYNINQAMEVGIMANNGTQITQSSVLGLRASTNSDGQTIWKKVYIDLSDAVSGQPYATGYKIYFYAKKADNVDHPLFLIDNIKLVSF